MLIFLFENISSILFYIIFANFNVLDIILERVIHTLIVKEKIPSDLEKVFYIYFYFYFYFFLEGDYYVVPYGTVVTGILDMRAGKHNLHFLIGVELLPHAFVNIPDEKMHIGVYFIFILLLIFYSFMYILKFFYVYLFIVF
jgi:hypothetical protein